MSNDIFNAYNESTYHDALVKKISEHSILQTWIDKKIKNDSRIINLITTDWINILKNNLIIQKYLDDNVDYIKYDSKNNKVISNYKILDHSNVLNLLVAGKFKLKSNEDNSEISKLVVAECKPLTCAAEIVCHKLKKSVLPNAAFFFQTCKGLCVKCQDLKVSPNNLWCIKDIMVYNKELKYATREYCESLYKIATTAIVHLELNTAYTFGEKCKIGGVVKNIIYIEDVYDHDYDGTIKDVLNVDTNFLPDENPNENKVDYEKRKNSLEDMPDAKRSKHLILDEYLALPNDVKNEKTQNSFDVEFTTAVMPTV